ncbi:MAG: hypothetical protein MUC84_06965 [Solirubrobacteraceae bacterium]|nr:hypothetical protein [Solirubrobacteraceae bacterium]
MPAVARMLAALASLTVLVALTAPAAGAAPVQEFGVQLKDVRSDGRFSVVFTANAYDTTGEPPPQLTRSVLRLPRGVTIRRSFLRRGRLCDTAALRELLLDIEGDRADYRTLLGRVVSGRPLGPDLEPRDAAVVRTCRGSAIGRGTATLDARASFEDPVPGLFHLFLARPIAKGAVAALGALAVPDDRVASVRDNPVLPEQRPLFTVDVFGARGGGPYGYRLVLPEQRVGLVTFSLTELRVSATGASRREGGRRVFWAALPNCPRRGVLPFRADYTYETGQTASRTVRAACPRFGR